MKRQYVDSGMIVQDECLLEGEEARHLATVLRVAAGDEVECFDGAGMTRRYRVSGIGRRQLTLEALAAGIATPRPLCAVTLFACVSKGNRMDWCVEKAVELGVARVVPVVSERTVVRLDTREGEARRSRWQRLAREAVRQCGSAWMPQVLAPLSLRDALPLVRDTAPVLLASLQPGSKGLHEALAALTGPPSQAGWFVGPEGDFTPAEDAALREAGAVPVTLGHLVLRAETAALYGLVVLHSRWLV